MNSLTHRRFSGCLILFVLVVFKRVVCSPVENINHERDIKNRLLKLFIPVNNKDVQAPGQEYRASNIIIPKTYVSSYNSKERLWYPEGEETRYDRSSDRWFHSKKDNADDSPENRYPDYNHLVKELPAQKSIEYDKVFRNNEEEDQVIHFDDEFSKTDQKYKRFTSNPGKYNNEYHHGHHHDFKHHSSFHHDYDFHHPHHGFKHDHNPECHFPHGGGPGRLPYPPRSLPRPSPPPSPPSTNVPSTTNSPAIPAIDPRQSTIASFASTKFPSIDIRWNDSSADKKSFRNRNEDAIVFPE